MATKTPSTNRGLTVRINLWALDTYEHIQQQDSRHFIKGEATNEHTLKKEKFNDAGQLLSLLGKWNSAQLKVVRSTKKGS